MMEPNGNRVMVIADVCAYLRCHQSTVYRLCKSGQLPHFRLGADFRFLESDIQQWIKDRTATPASVPTRKGRGGRHVGRRE